MSNKSIESKIQGIENRFKAEMRSRGDPAFASPSGVPPPRPGNARRPRPVGALTGRSRQMLDLPISVPTRSLDSIETDNKLKEIYKMSGKLNINGVQYQSVIEDLEHLGELGSGTCGHVVKMLHKPSGAIIAVKQMRRSGNSEENKRILMDLDVVLRSHDCPYIVRCLGCFITDADVWICMELMATCFDKLLKKLHVPIPEEILGQVTVATVKALSYLKDNHGVIHRDVKPSNILVDERGNVKLCDFGISGRLVDSKAKTRNAGCAAYMAPERISPPDPTKPDYDIRADVWSLGISLVELATGLFPYRDCQNDFEVLTRVIDEEPPSLPDSDAFSPEFKLFVEQCLMKNYRQRPKYGKLLEHPFLLRASRATVQVDAWITPLLQRATPLAVHRRVVNIPPISPVKSGISIRNNLDSNQTGQCDPANANITVDKVTRTNDNESPTKDKYDDDLDVILARNIMCNVPKNPSLTLPERKNGISFNLVSSDEDNTMKSPTNESNGDSAMNSFDGGGQIDSELESGSFSSMMNVDEAYSSSRLDVTMSSAENLPSTCNKSVEASAIPADATNNTNSRLILWNNVVTPSNSNTNERARSYSNSMAPETPSPVQSRHSNARCFIRSDSGSPTTYYANIEVNNYPFAGGSNMPVRSSGPESGDFRDHRYIGAQVSGNEDEGLETRRIPEKSQGVYMGGAPRFLPGQAVSAGYHHNPGGSCSQPASLEAYGERSGFSPYPRRRTCEKSLSPPPAPPARRSLEGGAPAPASRERWRTAERGTPPHGNTSPIVLQRFYHQQSQQRRSRADLSDSTRHRSLSREHSTGRSPEPPPRTGRNLSLGYEGQSGLLHELESRVPPKHYPPDRERNSSDETSSLRSPPLSNSQRANIQKYDGLANRSHSLNRCEGDRDTYTSSAREMRLHENSGRDRYEMRLQPKEEDRNMCVNSVLTQERLEARLKSEMERDKYDTRLHAREEDRDTVNSVLTRERLEARLKSERERERYEQRLHAREEDRDVSPRDRFNHDLNQRYDDSSRSSRFDRLHADLNRREEERHGNDCARERDENITKVSPHLSLHRKNGKDREDQGTNGSNSGSRSSSPGRQFINSFGRGHPKHSNQHKNQMRDSELADDVTQRLGGIQGQNGCYQDAANGSSGRYTSATPQPMPRRIVHTHATHSWSVPASPRLNQTSTVRPPPHE